MATTNELIAENNPNRIANLPAETSVPGWGEAKQASEAVGKSLYESPSFKGAVKTKDEMVKELYDYDKQLEGGQWGQSATTPMAQAMYGPEYVSHPGDIAAGQAGYATGMGKTIGATQGAIGDVSDYYSAAMSDVMRKFLDFFTLAEKRKERAEDRQWQKEQAEEDKRRWEEEMKLKRQTAGGGTAGEREETRIRNQIQADVSAGITLGDLMAKYGGVSSLPDILNAYKQSGYGAPLESMEEIKGMYEGSVAGPAVSAYADRIQSGEMNISNVPTKQRDAVIVELQDRPLSTEDRETYNSIMIGLDEMEKLMTPGKFMGIIPYTPEKAEIDNTKNILAMQIGRLFEKGRMSDKDRDYYLSLLPGAETPLETAKTQLNTLRRMINAQYSQFSEEGKGEWEVVK